MANSLDTLKQLMSLKQMQDSAQMQRQKMAADQRYRQQTYDLNSLVQKRLQSDRDILSAEKKAKQEYAGVYNTNLPYLLEAYKNDRTGFLQEAGAIAADYPAGAPKTALKDAGAMYDATYGKMGTGSDMLPALVRAYGSEAPFIMQTYGKGDVPQSAADFELLTREAASDPNYGKKRTQWANTHVANTMKNLGASADDPNKSVYEDRFGHQHKVVNQGDTIAQQLKNPTTEEVTKLSEYRNTYNEIEDIGRSMNDLFIGPYEGNWTNLKSKFANTPDFQTFKTKAAQLRTIIYGLSGKQINETEQKWLDSILPKIYQPDENFQANLDTLKEWVEDRQQAYLAELRSARRYTTTEPLKKSWSVDDATPEQEDAAFDALGVDATDADIDAWLEKTYGGK